MLGDKWVVLIAGLAHSRRLLPDGRIIALSYQPVIGGGTVVIFEDVTEREKAGERAQFLATHDDLTGLPNRWMFAEAVNDAVKAGHRYGHPFAIMFMDLDRFKNINDTLGHAAGDILLIETAKRLKECVRKSDVIARIGCWQEAGRLPVQWTAPWAEHDNATVRAPFGRVAYRDRARPTCLRHAFTAADQGDADLPSHGQSTSGSASARTHED
jgi:hypothetical protein